MTKLIIVLILILYFLYENKFFKVDRLELSTNKTKQSFKIVQISDFHLSKLINLRSLREKLLKLNPDIIVITGDIINRHSNVNEIKTAQKFLKSINIGKDIIFVKGNHEFDNKNYDILRNILIKNNINIESDFYEFGDYKIYLLDYKMKKDFVLDEKFYNILLIHDPLNYIHNMEHNFDMVFSGHIHGGQVRVPILGAIIDSDYKLLPKYSKGLYKEDDFKIYINAGLGSKFYIRIFNRCEISYIEVNS